MAKAPIPPSLTKHWATAVRAVTPPDCTEAKRDLRRYVRVTNEWRSKMGAGTVAAEQRASFRSRAAACPRIRHQAAIWRGRATAARHAYRRWWRFQYAWWEWLPRNWLAVAICESGHNPPNWEHSNSSFTSAFGISWSTYNGDAARMGAPPWHVRHTPRDEYRAALGHYNAYGDGWGCPGP